ncbi:MAG: ParB/RepB/Spo0J family partition protein [Candidatus Cloacimonetes bacterium]|nr:ParB/RepB/Spo0J family partition protein [Candidatus Cloacimonadota bacterium]
MAKKGFRAAAENMIGSKTNSIESFIETKTKEETILEIDIHSVKDNPYQPRKYFDDSSLQDLCDSIKENGIIQPIIITMINDDYTLVAGERRLRAAKMAGMTTIPAIKTTGNPLEISLIENLQRENLKPIEEAEALRKMIDDHNYSQEKLARVLGKSKATISELLSLVRLPDEIKEESRKSDVSKRILIEIAKVDNPKEMKKLFDRVINEKLTSDDLRTIKRETEKTDKTDKSDIEKTLKKIQSTNALLNKIDIHTLEQNKKEDIRKALKILNVIVSELLIGIPETRDDK